MGFLSDLFSPAKACQLDPEIQALIDHCDPAQVKQSFMDFVTLSEKDAQANGEAFLMKKEIVEGWVQFRDNPSRKTLALWWEMAPEFQPMLSALIRMR